jgi:hypothetical protein
VRERKCNRALGILLKMQSSPKVLILMSPTMRQVVRPGF